MREKILRLKVDTTQVLRETSDAVYLTEHDADQIIDLIYSEIEKVENPYHPPNYGIWNGFEDCRQKILSLLRPAEKMSV